MRLSSIAALLLGLAAALGPARAVGADGQVIIRTTPSGAAIVVEGVALGEAPRTIALPAGKHTITLTLPGHLPETHTVVVKPGQSAKVYVRLTKAGAGGLRVRDDLGGEPPPGQGTVTVVTDPPGLRVFVNGERVERPTPVSFDIGAGTYAVGIKADDVEVLSTSTVVKEGWKVQVKRNLQKEVAAARRKADKARDDDGRPGPGPGDARPGDGRGAKKCKCTPRAKLKACVEKRRACKLGAGERGGAYALCYSCPQFRRLKKKRRQEAETACDTRTGRIDDCVCRDIARVLESCLRPQEKCLRRCGRD